MERSDRTVNCNEQIKGGSERTSGLSHRFIVEEAIGDSLRERDEVQKQATNERIIFDS